MAGVPSMPDGVSFSLFQINQSCKTLQLDANQQFLTLAPLKAFWVSHGSLAYSTSAEQTHSYSK